MLRVKNRASASPTAVQLFVINIPSSFSAAGLPRICYSVAFQFRFPTAWLLNSQPSVAVMPRNPALKRDGLFSGGRPLTFLALRSCGGSPFWEPASPPQSARSSSAYPSSFRQRGSVVQTQRPSSQAFPAQFPVRSPLLGVALFSRCSFAAPKLSLKTAFCLASRQSAKTRVSRPCGHYVKNHAVSSSF